MNLMSLYQETAKLSIRTTLHMQKATDKITQSLIESSLLSKDANTNVVKEYVNNFYQVRQELLNKMAETAEDTITNYPFKKEIEELNTRTTENTKKAFELFSFPLTNAANTKK